MWIAVICQILKLSLSIDSRIDHFIELKLIKFKGRQYDSTLLLSLLPCSLALEGVHRKH